MKHFVVLFLIASLTFSGAGCKIVDPFLLALNLPLEVCALLNTGNSWNELETYDISDEIDEISTDYLDDIKASRVSDITVYMPNPPTSGTGSGTIAYALDGGPVTNLASFSNVPFDSLSGNGVSLLNTSLITYNPVALAALLSALQDSTGLPLINTVTIQTSGTTSVTVPQDTRLCAKIHYQLDVEI